MPSVYQPKKKRTVLQTSFDDFYAKTPLEYEKKRSGFFGYQFFFILGLMIFLYAGLRFINYLDKKDENISLFEQVIMRVKAIKTNYAYASEKQPDNKQEQKTESAEQVVQETEEDDEELDSVFFDPLSITSPNDVKVLKALGVRRQEIEKREELLVQKELELTILEKKVTEKVKALEVISERIKEDLRELDQQEVKKAQSLAKIYSSMKAKEAARIFEELDMPILLAVITRISEKKLAPIMALLPPEKAREITRKLSRRSTNLSRPMNDSFESIEN